MCVRVGGWDMKGSGFSMPFCQGVWGGSSHISHTSSAAAGGGFTFTGITPIKCLSSKPQCDCKSVGGSVQQCNLSVSVFAAFTVYSGGASLVSLIVLAG